ncbi:MAG: ATP-dependent 26S proteasome regulatory subunit [Bradymonadia bacterium]|jgi:ATP-dependent 26S proteasome regulatory subunit
MSPDNAELTGVVLQALADANDSAGAVLVIDAANSKVWKNSDAALLASRALLKDGQAERAIDIAPDTPEGALAKVRALHSVDRTDEARELYSATIADSAAFEDVELESDLKSTVPMVVKLRADGPRLRVIANDDTGADDLNTLLEPQEDSVAFKDVGGLTNVKKQIRKRIILPFQKPSLFQKFKKKLGGGILMYGPPGCGKTLLARATAGECDAEFFNIAISDVLDMYIGESERKLRALFDRARSRTPSVLFFDEIEALGGRRGNQREATSARIVSQFLAELDGFSQDNKGVLILGATNVPWSVDPAFRRPGRFDRVLFVPPPDFEARVEILHIQLADRPISDAIDAAVLAKRTSGFSGADLENLVETAADLAIEQALETGVESPIDQNMLLEALLEVRPTTTEWLTTARNYARYANEGGQYDEVLDFLKEHGKR